MKKATYVNFYDVVFSKKISFIFIFRIKESGISPPVPRNESDLDPAAKYHVVSHVQYIT